MTQPVPSTLPYLPPISEADLVAWIVRAGPGDRLTYWRGHLARDVWSLGSQMREADRRRLARVGRLAWGLAEDGWVHLVQERLEPGTFAYIAIARPKRNRQLPEAVSLPEAA